MGCCSPVCFPVFVSTPDSCPEASLTTPSLPPTGITGSYAVSESPVFTPVQLHSGLVWKVQAPEDTALGQKTKKEVWVSGQSCGRLLPVGTGCFF